MSKRLGYETTHVMLNLHRKMNKKMNKDPEINKSALVNGLLFKWFEGKLCPRCFSPNIVHHTCRKCNVPYIVCTDEEKSDGREFLPQRFMGKPTCECTVREMYGYTGE